MDERATPAGAFAEPEAQLQTLDVGDHRPDDRGGEAVTVGDTAMQAQQMIDAPLVSALVVTYNHENYIRQALDSVVSQKTSFPFEIIISEDCSTDSTVEIIESYVTRFPDRIRLMRSEVNLRDKEVLFRAMRAARGRYITFLDGDDYWVSPNKLQVQTDFMEAHPDSAISYHDVERVTDEGEVIRVIGALGQRGTIEDLIKGNFLGTCSVMIRRSALPDVPDWVREMPAADWPLYFLAAQSGFIDHIPDLLARYRIHGESYWATRPYAEQALMGFCMQLEIQSHLDPEYAPLFERNRRENAHYVLTKVLSETSEPEQEPSSDLEKQLQQAQKAATTDRIRLIEMRNRANEAEAARAGAEQKVADIAERLNAADAAAKEHQATARRLIEVEAVSAYISQQLEKSESEAKDLILRSGRIDSEARLLSERLETAKADLAVATNQLHNAQAEAQHLTLRLRSSEAEMQTLFYKLGNADATARELSARLQVAEAGTHDLANRLQGAEAASRALSERLHHADVEARDAEARGRELQTAIDAANRQARRIRRREKRIGIALGVVIAVLVAALVVMHGL